MVVFVLVFFEEPVRFKAQSTRNIVDLEGADMAIGILLGVKVLVSEPKVSVRIRFALKGNKTTNFLKL